MPYYKVPQRLTGTGPNVSFSSKTTYWTRFYIVPPIDQGTPINLNLLSDKAGRTSVILVPYDPQLQTIVFPPLVNVVFRNDQRGIVVFANATRSGPYMLMITSYNSTYQFSVSSVWSPFYDLRSATTFAILLIPIGLVTIYYDGIVERKEKKFNEALKGLPRQLANMSSL